VSVLKLLQQTRILLVTRIDLEPSFIVAPWLHWISAMRGLNDGY